MSSHVAPAPALPPSPASSKLELPAARRRSPSGNLAASGLLPGQLSDQASRRRHLLALGADCAGLGLGLVAEVLRLPPLPVEIASIFTVIDNEPRLRRRCEAILGDALTDLSLSLGNAAGQGLAHGSLGVLADMAQRTNLLAEIAARTASLSSAQLPLQGLDVLPGTGGPLSTPKEPPNTPKEPPKTPKGPVERHTSRSNLAGAAAATLALASTRSPRRAAAMIIAGLPKASRLGREAFAAQLGRHLAKADVVVLDGSALRRLDRVDTLVIPAELLAWGPTTITTVLWAWPPAEETTPASDTGPDEETVGRPGAAGPGAVGEDGLGGAGSTGPEAEAEEALAALWDPSAPMRRHRRKHWELAPLPQHDKLAPDLQRLAGRLRARDALLLRKAGLPVAVVGVGHALDESATRLVAAARRQGLTVAIAGGDERLCESVGGHLRLGDFEGDGASNGPRSTTEPRGSKAAAAEEDRGELTLASEIAGMQGDGMVVALLARGRRYAEALQRADVGVELLDETGSWSGDVVVGSMEEANLLIDAVARAKQSSRQSVAMSVMGSSVGGLAAIGGPSSRASARAARAVNLAALASMANGVRLAASLPQRTPPAPLNEPWHQMSLDDVAEALGSRVEGLEGHEALRRRHDLPVPPGERAPSLWRAMLKELANPLTPVLAGGAAAAAAVGSPADAAIVAGVSALNAVVGGAQRYATERSIKELAEATSATVEVRRPDGGGPASSAELVPGDVVVLRAGDAVPADCRVIMSRDAEVDESSLTGESEPVGKRAEARFAPLLADRSSMVYEGTTVAAGEIEAMVVATGSATAASSMAALVGEAPGSGGVEARLRRLTKLTLPISLAGGAALMASGALHARPARDSVGAGVALAVAAVPEGLPLLATMAQLASARRLSSRGALVPNPRAIEALGRVEVLCTDKTGTLTEGRIRLRRISDGRDDVGIADFGPAHRRVLAAALRASPPSGGDTPPPHLTDKAVLEGAANAGVEVDTDASGWSKLDELPFEPARGYHATLGASGETTLLSVKGAPETILPRCSRCAGGATGAPGADIDAPARRELEREVERLASQGLRVLAVAERRIDSPQRCGDEDVDDLTFLGFLAFSDPVRKSAEDAVAGLRRAGVEVVMVTGDHPSTARGIAVELGILNGGRLLTGWDLASMDDATLEREAPQVTVFARVTPADKVRIVTALQANGKAVAMTGDGANDAPAIRLADAGIALGVGSTSAARRAADVVVTDGRIETIVDAVIEGRSMWTSVREAVAILVGGNLGEVAFTVAASAITGIAPLSARQLLLVNLLTDVAPALAIALRPPQQRNPEALLDEGPDASLGSQLERAMVVRAGATALGAGTAWTLARLSGTRQHASTTALVALVGTQLGQTLMSGRPDPRVLAAGLGSAAVLVGAVQFPPVSRFLGCRPLGPLGWSIACSCAALATGASLAGSRLADRYQLLS